MNTYIADEKPPTARNKKTIISKMKKDCGCKDRK
jgi:hypothetical protein